MKALSLLLLLTFCVITLTAQTNCYGDLQKKGLAYLNQKNYREAINIFFRMRYCPDAERDAIQKLDDLIKQAQDAWVQALDNALYEAEDARAEAEALRDQAQLALDRATQQKIRAESAEQKALRLAANADTLRTYLRGDSTYQVFLRNGRSKFRNGDYEEAKYDFAVARFTLETAEAATWLQQALLGLKAERSISLGDLEKALAAFEQMKTLDNDDHRTMRLEQLRITLRNFQKAIQENEPQTAKSLKLQCYFIPREISAFRQLRSLDLSYNQFTGIFLSESWMWLSRLESLENLNLSYNTLAEYPAALDKITTLEQLDLSYNYINSPEISNENLAYLNLRNNALLDTDESDWNFLTNLPNLKELDIRGNHLSGEVIDFIREKVPKNCRVLVQ